MRLIIMKQTPLIAILLINERKSLIFIMLAMLFKFKVTIVIILYVKLKRQLITRYIDASLDCKHWPKARGSWPRVILVLIEAISSDDFLK
jgi:hypothetical protein